MIKFISKPFSCLLIGIASLVAMNSCHKEESHIIPAPPAPRVVTHYECPKEGDIYKFIIDTFVFNEKVKLFTTFYDNKGDTTAVLPLDYDIASIPLGVCAKTADLCGKAKYSPLAAKIKNDEGISRSIIWDRNGNISDIIAPEDIKRIQKFPNNKKVTFEVALLDFNGDTIQTSPVVIMFNKDFPKN